MEITWNETSRAAWETLADRVEAPMQQRWSYGAAHAALGGRVLRAVIRDRDRPVAACQFLSRRLAHVLPAALATRGPLWFGPCDQPRAFALMRKTLPLPRLSLRLFTLPGPGGSGRFLPLMRPATTAHCALPTRPEALHGKWRNALRKAGKSGLVLHHVRPGRATLAQVLERDGRQQREKSFRALPAAFTLAWQHCAPGDIHLFSASQGHDTVAQALFLRHGNSASYHIALTSDAGRACSAQRLVLWRAFQDLAALGVSRVDLGSIDTKAAPGLARFKLGTGAQAQRLGPTILAL